MKKSVFFLLLQRYVLAALDVSLTSGSCGGYYDMEDVDDEEIYLTYDGARLDNDECSLQLMNFRTNAKQTCIKPLNLRLDCSTKLEYRRSSLSEYQDPEVQLSCGDTSLNEYCGPFRTSRLYIVFRTASGNSQDYVSLRIYLKDFYREPEVWDTDTSSSTSTSAAVTVVPIVVSVIFTALVIGTVIARSVIRRRRMQAMARTTYAYQTAGGPVITQTGQGNVTPAAPMTGYNPQQQPPFQPATQGNFQVHPMQSAYPVPPQQGYSTGTGYLPVGQTDNGRHSPANTHPSAPPLPSSDTDAPPPSYEMVAQSK